MVSDITIIEYYVTIVATSTMPQTVEQEMFVNY